MMAQKRIAKMRQRATCQMKLTTQDSLGGCTDVWHDITMVWAHLSGGSSSVSSAAGQTIRSHKFDITVRYREDLKKIQRIIIGGRIFNISNVSDPDERRRYLIFAASEGELVGTAAIL